MRGLNVSDSHRFDLLKLDNQLCFALYAATRAMTRTYRERLGPMGLTYPQYIVLTVLWEKDGPTISELGRALMLDSGTLTPLLKRLEGMELVSRKRRFEDEREVEVWLTPKGLDIRELALGAREHVVCRLDMSEQEISRLRRDLMDLIRRLSVDGYLCVGEVADTDA
ncbi:MAG: MarR family winged helix-turn-helix transcriptional regulator [Hyphomicrobium sp.]